MNVMFWITFQPKAIKREWSWRPRFKRSGWPALGRKFWYLNCSWLNFGIALDNEL